jgi:hypothetical protein
MAFKLKLHHSMGMVEDTVSITDPWNSGLRLRVNRIGSRAFRRFVREQATRNPVVKRMNAAVARLVAERMVVGESELPTNNHELMQELLHNALDRELEVAPLSDAEGEAIYGSGVEEAVVLLVDWSGEGAPRNEQGEMATPTEANKRELFTDPTPVPDGQPFEGMTLGEAFVRIVRAAAEGADVMRDAWLRRAGKVSGPGSELSSSPGPTTPLDASTPASESSS